MNLPNLFASQPEAFVISSVKFKKTIDQQLADKLTDYLQSTYKHLSKLGLHKIMIQISGEINSIVTGVLLKQTLRENTVAMIFDFGTAQTNKLIEICNYLGLEAFILKRGMAYQTEASAYRLHTSSGLKKFYQRFINYHLFIQADNMKTALVDTLDKSERLADTRPEGFYGCMMPFYSLYKSELYDLARFLNIPPQFINITNYQELPYPDITLSWDKLDPILFLLTEKQLKPEEISEQFKIDLPWLKRLKSHIYKHSLKTTVSQFII